MKYFFITPCILGKIMVEAMGSKIQNNVEAAVLFI